MSGNDVIIRMGVDDSDVPQPVKRTNDAIAAIGKTGEVSARQTAAAMRTLPAQFTDIATQLAGGSNPLLVLLQQGGQIKDSFGGIAPAARAIGAAVASIAPSTLVLAGLAAAGGTLAYGFIAGSNESSNLKRALAETGNQAGVTLSDLDRLSRGMAANGRITIGTARDITAGLVDLGTFSGQSFDAAGRAAAALAVVSGKSADEVVKAISTAAEAPLAFAQKANAAYHFLSAAQYEQIRSLQAQGREQEAARVALEALAATMEQRAVPSLGTFDRTVLSVKASWSGFVDGLKSIGRDKSIEENIAALGEKVERLRLAANNQGIANPGEFFSSLFGPSFSEQAAQAQAEKDALQEQSNRDKLRNAERGITQKAQDDAIANAAVAHQNALASVDKAGGQLRLVQLRSALAESSTALEQAFTRDEVAARAYQQARLAIDLAGIDAETAALQRQKAAEAALKPSTRDERLQQRAAVLALDTQIEALAAKRRQRLADEAAGKFDVAPKADQLPGDALRRMKDLDYQQVDKADREAGARRVTTDRQTLQDLKDQNARAAAELLTDERAKGEALINLDKQIAMRRLAALDLTPEARAAAAAMVEERARLDGEALKRNLGQGAYEDVRGAISAALQDSSGNPVKAFAQTLGNAVFQRATQAMANAAALNLVGKDGQSGWLGQLLGLVGALGGGSNIDPASTGYDYQNQMDQGYSHRSGIDYVPYDGYRIEAHKGERLLTASRASQAAQPVQMALSVTNHIEARSDRAQVAEIALRSTQEGLRAFADEMAARGMPGWVPA